jgi:phage portal protein BeeE
VLDPQKVTIKVGVDGNPVYVVSNGKESMEVGPEAMVHIPLFATGDNMRGMSPVEHHRVTLGLASATQLYSAKFYEQGVV